MSAIDRIPADGVIARRYVALDDTLSSEQLLYLYPCLIAGMRGEPLPRPRRDLELSAAQAEKVRERARERLPEIEEVRSGEQALPAPLGTAATPSPAPETEPLPF